MVARKPLSATDDRSVFDSISLFGSLIVARNTDDASLHLYLSNPDDQVTYFKTESEEPAIYQLPACTGTNKKHLGDFFTFEGSLLIAENCPGQILTIQSTLNDSGLNDENSWLKWFLNNSMKIVMTCGFLGTGIFQYFKHKNQVKAPVGKDGGG